MRDYLVVSSTLLSADLAQATGKQSGEEWTGLHIVQAVLKIRLSSTELLLSVGWERSGGYRL